ncbi:MAG: esterase-like activity of phytase family protein, partial [Pseudomonadota bacterium]
MRKLAAIFLLLGACNAADAGSRGSSMLYIDAEAVDISGGALNGLKLRGTMNLTADPRAFGGFSGLHIDGGRLSAITDHGWLLQADLKETDRGLIPVDAAFAPMLDIDGAELDRAGRDAEGLTIIDGDFAVSFERDHRIMFRQDDGRLGQSTTHRAFEALGSNKGLEALATTAEDAIIAIAEEPVDGAFPMHLLRRNKGVVLGSLPALSRHNVTGADVGEDQRLYLLLRDFSPFRGVSMRILR